MKFSFPADKVLFFTLFAKGYSFKNVIYLFILGVHFLLPFKMIAQEPIDSSYTIMDTALAVLLMDEGQTLIKRRNTVGAIDKFEKARDIFQQTKGKESLNTANAIRFLGMAKSMNGNNEEALALFKEVLDIKITLLGKDHPQVAEAYTGLGIITKNLGFFDQSIKYQLKSLDIIIQTFGAYHPNVAGIYNNIGVLYKNMGDFDKSIESYRKALSIYLLAPKLDSSSVAMLYKNIGLAYDKKGQENKAVEYHQKALTIRLNLSDNNLVDIADSYTDLGTAYSDKGEYDIAIEYYQKALSIYLNDLKSDNWQLSIFYNNLGNAYTKKEEYNKAIEYHQKALDIRIKHLGPDDRRVSMSYNNLGVIHKEQKKYNKAIEYSQKALNILQKAVGVGHLDTGSPNINLGNVYLRTGEYDRAMECYHQALDIYFNALGPKHPLVATAHMSIATCFSKKKLWPQAEVYFDKALRALNYEKISSITQVSSIPDLITILSGKAAFFRNWNQNTLSIEKLYQSRKTYQDAFQVLDYQFKTLSPISQSTFPQTAHSIYEGAILTNQLLAQLTDSIHYLHDNFKLAERSKALLLYGAMKESQALSIAGIPDSMLQKEFDLRIDIAHYDKWRQEKLSSGLGETDTSVLEITSKLFDLNRKYEALKKDFEYHYPKYYKAKYDLSALSVEEVQKKLLQPDQTLLEYMVGENSIFLFLVQQNYFEFHEIKHDFPLEALVEQLTKEGIYGFYSLPNDQRNEHKEDEAIINYTHAALQLYERLIAPVKKRLTARLILIPDGILGYLPFEALLTNIPKRTGNFSTYPYLIYDHVLSYSYSSTLLQEMKEKQHQQLPTGQLLAMAPFFLGNTQELKERIDSSNFFATRSAIQVALNPLPGSGEEVAAVAKIFNGIFQTGSAASLKVFQGQSNRYRILHLSTHGKADPLLINYTYLAFSSPDKNGYFDKLYSQDLYHYTLNADMVVLSACETGTGKLRKGEGIISLARAFAYAGAKSIFTTLWQVDDDKTKDLMIFFYKNLRLNADKDASLQNAKVEFLTEQKKKNGGLGMHPYYWAGMIGIGDMSKIE